MASIYLANVAGDGQTTSTAYRPSGFDAVTAAVLMVDRGRGKCLVYSPDDTVTGVGVNNLVTAPDRKSLVVFARTHNVPAGARTAINNWLINGGWPTVPADIVTWWDVVHFVIHLANPGGGLDGLVI